MALDPDLDPDNLRIWVDKFNIKHNHKVHLINVYRAMHDWLYDMQYVMTSGDKYSQGDPDPRDAGFPEYYHHLNRVMPEKQEAWIWWRPTKHLRMYQNIFWYKHMEIVLHFRNIKDVEVLHHGQKMKAQAGEVDIQVATMLVINKKAWDKNWLTKAFFDIFWKRIYHNNIEGLRKETYEETKRFYDFLKKLFDLYSFGPPKKPYVVGKGLGQIGEY